MSIDIMHLERRHYFLICVCTFILILIIPDSSCTTHCDEINCREGECINDSCICDKGWKGPACQHCTGRVRLTDKEGIIFDGYGNYSEDNKCTWLIAPENNTQPIHLQLKQFSTECGWDHLYIYDGDSTFSPLLVAFSGLLRQKNEDDTVLPEITTTSGNAYIYFYSDAAYNMSGFNITYRTGGCEKDCLQNGQCKVNKCECFSGFTGDYCQTVICPNNCSDKGECKGNQCKCFSGYTGSDCSQKSYYGVWSTLDINTTIGGRASAAVAQVQDKLYLTGGYTFNNELPFLTRYDFNTDSWNTITPLSTNNPESRYGHTLLEYQGKLYMFGGVVDKDTTKELWVYDLTSNLWTLKNYNSTPPVAVASHTAHVINGVMYILFGYSPIYGYKNRIQEYFIGNDTWIVPRTFGSVVEGGFGHSSVYDPHSKLIYVYGGYHAGDTSSDQLSDKLYSFDIRTRFWKTLPRNERPRYLHSAVLIGGLMLVFGGNTHNDTSISLGAKCYSLDFLAYDTECNKWLEVDVKGLPSNGARYGHTAAVYKRNGKTQMYIIGGFNGMMQDNVMLFSPGDCNYTDPEFCTNSTQGSICVWTDSQTCISKDVLGTAPTNRSCSSTPDHNESCKDVKDCRTCTSTCLSSHGDCTCQWCDSKCTYNCTLTQPVTTISQCPAKYSSPCYATQNCFACIQSDSCEWNHSDKKCQAVIYTSDYNTTRQVKKCDQPCIAHKSCENCTSKGCMWCGNKQLCVQTNSYVASFIYGQCMEWTTQHNKCPATRCSDLHTCDECQANPKCGWCNDKSNTGLGKCMEGGLQGPVNNQSQIDYGSCDKNRWFFIGCPDCQCNGHSVCSNSTGKTEVCVECKNMTEGDNCEHCKEGFYGDPVNGGICRRCDCNEQADSCDRVTGKCNCRTRGVIGDKCDKCDESHKYFGDPKKGGTCFYHLVTDYQFTFNLSKKDDRFYTQINFMNIPQASDRDVDFKVNCSGESYLNISVRTRNNRVEKIYEAYPCTYFRTKFEHGDFSFGEKENTTFLVYVYGFHTPFWLQISFSQFPKIDLVHFFVTFFSCFLSLLIIAAVLYKIKHKYDLYRRRQRMMVEMEEMASRPFASVTVEIDRKLDLAEKKETNSVDLRKRKKGGTKPVAIQPLSGHKAAILSLIVLLPTGGEEDLAPSGSSGVAIASALITMGHHRKQSLEHTKGEKTKYKKPFSSSHTDPV
ncbi:attractin-like protein 1 isoform X2 [Mytilus trossulus]|uniref:attractin-like protein 1 isoform X2 n=1 Tax=Mytilus trossulus TaxID=6551 RepID=UPI003007A2C1